MSLVPKVNWQPPELIPDVPKYDMALFWIAVESTNNSEERPVTVVFAANYVNSPLDLDENGEPINGNHHVDDDGEPIGSVGWHNEYDHPDFNGYFQPICFNERYKLLGWAEYVTPVWEGIKGAEQCAT